MLSSRGATQTACKSYIAPPELLIVFGVLAINISPLRGYFSKT